MTTRAKLLREYKTYMGPDGAFITSPGKFEGQPIYAPYFWELGLDGGADEDNARYAEGDGEAEYIFNITADDREKFPDIPPDVKRIGLVESEQGFVEVIFYDD